MPRYYEWDGGMGMYIYEGNIVKMADGRFHASILKISHDQPNHDMVMERELDTYEDANIWIDDELSRINTGKGIWE